MKLLFWFLLIILTFRYIFRIFGRGIMNLLVKNFAKHIQNDFNKQQQHYERYTHTNPFNESVYQEEEVRVTAPKVNKQKRNDVFEVAEEVDYEEIK